MEKKFRPDRRTPPRPKKPGDTGHLLNRYTTKESMKYDHKYRSCTRTYSTLRIYPKAGHPNEITKRLGIKPSSTSVAGERKILGKPCVNGWFLCTRGKIKSKDSRRHIDWILDKIEPVIEEILALKKEGAFFDIMCFWGSATGNGGPTISPEQMRRLVNLDLDVWWDVYFEGEDEEAAQDDV